MSMQRPPLIAGLEKAWAGDLDTLLSLYADDCRFEDKAFSIVHHGHAGLREVFAFTYRMMPDFRAVYGEHVIGDDHAATKWTFTGTFSGEFQGVQYDCVPVRIEGVSFMKLSGGQIVHNCDYWNVGSLGEQLAASPAYTKNDRPRTGGKQG